ncbi:MAG: hypothetical protein GF308_20125 [Candidatus Heimdallarchaeota archaeon]|nr:hypothetical protein [Candidatus Heimdallarchaeota archaeon]
MSQLEQSWELLQNLAEKTINHISKKEPTGQAEAFFTSFQTTEVSIRNSEILTQNKIHDSGVGFRVFVEDKVGFTSTNHLTEKAFLKTIDQAVAIAKVSHKSPHFAFPEESNPPQVQGLYDSKITETTVEDAVDLAKRLIFAAEDFDKRITAKTGRVVFNVGYRGVINNLGVNLTQQETKAVMYLGGSGQQGNEVTGGCYESMLSRKADLNPEKVGENLGKKIVRMFNKKQVKKFSGTVIFDSDAVSYQIANVINEALNGENMLNGSSAWADKLSQRVASENLYVRDDPLIDYGFASRVFDDEGATSQKTQLIHEGKLQQFLHLSTSAKAAVTKTTANACRTPSSTDLVRNIVGTGYRVKPVIYPSNLVIVPGKKTKEELIAEIDKGVLIESMAGFPQRGSGQLSAQLSRAYYVEKGEILFPIKDGMVSGVIFDWLQNISEISRETKQYQNAILPTIQVEGVKVMSD